MGQLSDKLRGGAGGRITYWCQGCQEPHTITSGWKFDGDLDAPTFSPSVLVTSGHYTPGHSGDCWCTYNAKQIAEGKQPSAFRCERCHTHIRGGMVQFLRDCTHALAGQTLPLPPLPDHMRDP